MKFTAYISAEEINFLDKKEAISPIRPKEFLLFLNKLQIVNSMAFKLPFLKGKCNSDGSLDCHGLPLFAWKQLRDKEEAIGRGSYGLVCATFYAATKTHGNFSITKDN